jgi:hypothetical protein
MDPAQLDELQRRLDDTAEEYKQRATEFGDAHAIAMHLVETKRTLLAEIMNELSLQNPKWGESKLRRSAEIDSRYKNHLTGLKAARTLANSLRAARDTVKIRWQSAQSQLSYEKALISNRLWEKGR